MGVTLFPMLSSLSIGCQHFVLKQKSPFEILYVKPPTYMDFNVFGCLAYASTLTQNRHTLDPWANSGPIIKRKGMQKWGN